MKEPCLNCGCPGEQYDGHVCEDFLEEPEDRNADLVGFEYGAIKVEGSAPWNDAYVIVSTPLGPSCRPAALVRARKLGG